MQERNANGPAFWLARSLSRHRLVSGLPLHGLGWAMGVAALATAAAARTTTTGAATTARTTAAATAAARPRRLRIRHLDGDPSTVQLAPVELGDRVLGCFRRVHLDEAEPARLAGEAVGDDGRREHAAALAEDLSQAVTGSGVRKTADIQLGRHRNPRSLPLIGHAPRTGRDVTPEARSVRSCGGHPKCTLASARRKYTTVRRTAGHCVRRGSAEASGASISAPIGSSDSAPSVARADAARPRCSSAAQVDSSSAATPTAI